MSDSIKRLWYFLLIHFDPHWNSVYSSYHCKTCFWNSLPIGFYLD